MWRQVSPNWSFVFLGAIFGFFWCLVWFELLSNGNFGIFFKPQLEHPKITIGDRRLADGTGPNRDGPKQWPENMTIPDFKYSALRNADDSLASNLTKSIKVFCLVTTTTKFHKTRAPAIRNTWGRRCNKILFLSDSDDATVPAKLMSNSSDYLAVWEKVKNGFLYAFQVGGKDFDWFLKADDDTYVILENLRAFLSKYSSNDPIFVGRHLKSEVPTGFQSGGAGYVLSRQALRVFYEYATQKSLKRSSSVCDILGSRGIEDVEMGRCLFEAGAKPIDSRDLHKKHTFFPYTPTIHLSNDTRYTYWLSDFDFHASDRNLSCCGDNSISFHYISPTEMYALDYLIYHLRPFGIEKSYA